MKKMIQIALLKVKLTFKDKTAFAMMFLAPIIFIIVLVAGFGGGGASNTKEVKYVVSIANNDQGEYSKQFLELLKKDTTFSVREEDSTKVNEDVKSMKIPLGLIIPEGFSASIEEGVPKQLALLKLSDEQGSITLVGSINNYLNDIVMGRKTGEATAKQLLSMKIVDVAGESAIRTSVEKSYLTNAQTPVVGVTLSKIIKDDKKDTDSLSTTAIGIIVLFIMFFVSGGAKSILEEKEIGTWNKMNSTATKGMSVFGGFVLGNFILGWIQVGVLIIFSKYVLKINWGISPIGLILLFSCFLLSIIGLGTCLASFVKSKKQLASITNLIVMPTSLIAGCMWPREIMPDFMIKLSNFIPQTWVLKGMTDLITRNSSINAILIPCGVLLLFASVFFIVGISLANMQRD